MALVSSLNPHAFSASTEKTGITFKSRPEGKPYTLTCPLNPPERKEMMELIYSLAHGGYTIVFIEHDIDAVLAYAQRVTVMYQGKLIAEGTPAEISNNNLVQEVYLGGGW